MSQSFFWLDPINLGALTSSWVDKDVSAHIPVGSTGVLLRLVLSSTAFCGFRKKGSSGGTRQITNDIYCAMVGVDTDRIFQAYGSGTLYLVGYTNSSVTFYDNVLTTSDLDTDKVYVLSYTSSDDAWGLYFQLYDGVSHSVIGEINAGVYGNGSLVVVTPVTKDAWVEIDLSAYFGIMEGAIGFFYLYAGTDNVTSIGIRPVGSSEDIRSTDAFRPFCKLTNNKVEVYVPNDSGVFVQFYAIVTPLVSTYAAEDVVLYSATLRGRLTDTGRASDCACNFEWGKTISYGEETTAEDFPDDTTYSKGISGLDAGETYHFRAKATNGAGSSYGSDRSFTTEPAPMYTVIVDASLSYDPDGSIAEYKWLVEGGSPVYGVTKIFNTELPKNITLTVTDDDGLTDAITRTIPAPT